MKKIFLLVAVLASVLFTRCYYDVDERINYDLSSGCDAANVTYTTCVKPIVDNNCKGCHGANRADGGVKLDSYADMKAHYSRSMIRIKAGTMPQSGKLPLSDITIMDNWGKQGQKQ